MKRYVMIAFLLAIMSAPTMAGTTFSFSNVELANVGEIYDNPSGGAYLPAQVYDTTAGWVNNPYNIPGVNGVHYSIHYTQGIDWNDDGYYFSQIAVGYDGNIHGYSNRWNDLSAYDSWYQSFHMVGDSSSGASMWVNLCLNTGWTDIGEPDHYYESAWKEIFFCEDNSVLFDLSGISDAELQHVTSIRMQIGANIDQSLFDIVDIGKDLNGWDIGEIQDGKFLERDVIIDTIPAPGAILLGSIGIGLVGFLRRRKAL